MIKYKLIIIEQETINSPNQNYSRLEAIRKIKKLLTQIDFNAEEVPMDSAIKLEELLSYLKGAPLTKEESKVVNQLVA